MSLPDQIEATEIFQSGEPFGPMRMAKALCINRQRANHALSHMVNIGRAQRAGRGLYMKPKPKHWIHSASLANAKALHAARVLV